MQDRFLLVTTVKNEGPNILEWVAHHLAIGFDSIQVYQNDSDDETQKHLRTLERVGAIEYFNNPSRKQQWQNKAYRRASRSEAFQGATWCMALDGDEFLHVKVGEGRVQDLAAACQGADEILVNWRMFGSGGHKSLSDALVTERYVRTERDDAIARELRGYKALFKTDAYKRPGIHRAKVPLKPGPVIMNGSGKVLALDDVPTWRTRDPACRALAQVNHYAIRDAASFLLKSYRGSASHPDRTVAHRYWSTRDYDDAEDRALADRAERTWEKMRELDARSKGRLLFLRENSLRLWREKLAEILQDPEYAELYAGLT